MLADIGALILSFHLAYFVRIKVIPALFNVENPWFFPVEHFYRMYYLLFIFIIIFTYEKLYSRRYDVYEEFVYIARGLFISVIFIAVFIYLSRTFASFSRTVPLLMVPIGMIIVPLLRRLVKKLLMASGFYIKNAVVVCGREQSELLGPIVEKLESAGYHIVCTLAPEDGELVDTVEKLAGEKDVETLVIVSEGIAKEQLNGLINGCEQHVKELKILSDASYIKTIGVETEYLDELLVMRMANNLLSPFNRFMKRGFDIFVSLVSIVLLLPLFLVIALGIKIGSRGPVFFVQERFGREGKKFKFLKFRSMYRDADAKLKDYLHQNPQLQLEWEQYKKLKSDDPRVTVIGKFLRRFSLDEAPQLLNVLIGDMSIVGPRPYLIREKEEIRQSAAIIFRVQSGLTGLWQIKGRNELSFDVRLKLDEFYVRNWSFFLDLVIILKTFGAVLKGKGAY